MAAVASHLADISALARLHPPGYATIQAMAGGRPYTITGHKLGAKPPWDAVNKLWPSTASASVYVLLLS